jgi:hypothetical protein
MMCLQSSLKFDPPSQVTLRKYKETYVRRAPTVGLDDKTVFASGIS